jgi:sensor histidine kinase YesM
MYSPRDERNIWKFEVRRALKGIGISVGVALAFYVFNLPHLHGLHAHIKYILMCFMYGIVIYFFVWITYWIQWLVTGRAVNPTNRIIPISTRAYLAIAGTIMGLYVAQHLDAWISNEQFTYSQYWQSIFYSVFIAMTFQFYYAWKHSAQENLALKAAKAEAELHVLRNQMQPHFLFNSLNSLAALIDISPDTAGEATQKLADLYRLILECSKSPLSQLDREEQIAHLYLEIEKIRFGRRLSFLTPDLSSSDKKILVPSLVIQTLVENAVKHGISGSTEGGFVHLSAIREPSGLRIEVVNSGAPFAVNSQSAGTGVRNTKERLGLAFGTAHVFQIGKNSQGFTSAAFLIPEKS